MVALVLPALARDLQFKLGGSAATAEGRGRDLTFVSTLPSGTVVRIPDRFLPHDLRGNAEFSEEALIQWLKASAGDPEIYYSRNEKGEPIGDTDYFVPVEVRAADNPGMAGLEALQDREIRIAIRSIANKDGVSGAKLLTTDANGTPYVSAAPQPVHAEPLPNLAPGHAGAAAPMAPPAPPAAAVIASNSPAPRSRFAAATQTPRAGDPTLQAPFQTPPPAETADLDTVVLNPQAGTPMPLALPAMEPPPPPQLAPAASPLPPPAPASPKEQRLATPSEITAAQNQQVYKACQAQREIIPSEKLSQLKNDLNQVLAQVEGTKQYRASTKIRTTPAQVEAQLSGTCGRSGLVQTIAEECQKAGIPPELLLAMLQQESAGNCTAVGPDRPPSIGLFQIAENGISAGISFCQPNDASAVNNPNCIQNPLTNLREAIRILRSKFKSVNDRFPQPPPTPVASQSPAERDLWRKAIMAYNGGQAYVFQAYNDIKSFNAKFHTNYNPDNWEVRRLFLFRMALAENGRNYHDNNYRWKRSQANAVSNLAYTELALGRDPSAENANPGVSYAAEWAAHLKK